MEALPKILNTKEKRDSFVRNQEKIITAMKESKKQAKLLIAELDKDIKEAKRKGESTESLKSWRKWPEKRLAIYSDDMKKAKKMLRKYKRISKKYDKLTD
jgi:hypothetical protein